MPLLAWISLVALAAPDPRLGFEPERLTVLAVVVEDTPPTFARILGESLAMGLQEGGAADVRSGDDVAQVIDLQIQRQLIGCEDATCIVEVGGELEAEALVGARVTRDGDRWVGEAKLLDLDGARVFRRVSRDVDRESRLPTLMRVLGIELMGGTPGAALLDDLGPEPEPPLTSWHVGVTAGALAPQGHYFGEHRVEAKTGFLFQADADFAVVERVSMGLRLSLARFSYGKQLVARVLDQRPAPVVDTVWFLGGMTTSLRFRPVSWLQIRPGFVVGFSKSFVEDARIGHTDGFVAGGQVRTAFALWRGLAGVAEVGFVAQPMGGNGTYPSSFPPQAYLTLGAEWGGGAAE